MSTHNTTETWAGDPMSTGTPKPRPLGRAWCGRLCGGALALGLLLLPVSLFSGQVWASPGNAPRSERRDDLSLA